MEKLNQATTNANTADLKQRAERLKAKADAIDATKTADELRAICEAVKNNTADALKQAQTAEAIKAIADICGSWSALVGLFDDLARFTTKATGKTFTSPEAITKTAENIKERAQSITEKLNALSVAEV